MSHRTLVMGIVNRTPDSFYDGGRMGLDESVAYAQRLLDDGADILDIGGVKAGPGGSEVSEAEEMDRLLPLIQAIAASTRTPLSVETARPPVAAAAIERGASIVNDVTALAEEGLAAVCAERGAKLVLMHNGGQRYGRPMNQTYKDVTADVIASWEDMARRAVEAGVPASDLIVDPGLDFGKNTYHSLELMRRMDELVAAGRPVLVAPSRKDVVGESLGLPPEERLEGTLALVALSAKAGVSIVRVHDVAAACRVTRMVDAVAGRIRPADPVRGLWE